VFEEIAVWEGLDGAAIRYSGFRTLRNGQVWIGFANLLPHDENDALTSDDLVCATSLVDYFLTKLPTDSSSWKENIAAAVDYFKTNNPRD
jgi:hypothetical protein